MHAHYLDAHRSFVVALVLLVCVIMFCILWAQAYITSTREITQRIRPGQPNH